MKVIETLDNVPVSLWSVVTVGTFDGVHLGHQAILRKVLQRSEVWSGTSLVLTFEPHPRHILRPDVSPQLLTTTREKLIWLERLGIAVVVLLPFTRSLAEMPPGRFVDEILLEKCKAKEVIIGYDHGFGKDRAGSLDLLQRLSVERGFSVNPVPRVICNSHPVSSTRIRELLTEGNVSGAASLLGYPYTIVGMVIRGDGRGRVLGFPTINIAVDREKLLPGDGVYAVRVRHPGGTSSGVMNLGIRPTVNGKQRSLECHLLDFDGDLYGQEVEISLVERLRDEQKFQDLQDLVVQIEKDVGIARHVLQSQ